MDKRKRLVWIMPMTGHSTSKNKIEAADNIIENNIFNLSNFRNIFVDTNNGWKTESDSRSLRRWLHTHIFLADFTRAYAETEDEKYFTESFKLIENWFETFPIEKRTEIDPLSYHDEGSSIRLLFWFKYYSQFYNLLSDEQKQYLENQFDKLANLLSDDKFYAGLNNHGMFQDMGLIAYSLFKFENFGENPLFNKSLNRIEEYFSKVFTSDGIHKEHAPSYHLLLIYSLKQILESLEKAGYKDSRTEFLDSVYRKGEDYSINIILPDLKLPNISDSTVINMSTIGRYKHLYDSEEYKYITTGRKEGKAPEELIHAYPDSGYLVARNSWENDATYFLFLASYHMHYHKHTDDLSFLLYKNGPIFVDAGPHGYNYKDPMTQFAYSQYAHSTLIVNDASLPRTDNKFDDVNIDKVEMNENEKTFTVRGYNSRFKNVRHSRTIKGDLKNENFHIRDFISSEENNKYQLLFQVNGALNLIKHGKVVSIFKNNAKIAELEIAKSVSVRHLNIKIVREQEWPTIKGFQFPKTEQREPMNTIIVEFFNRSKNCSVETEIRLNNFKITGNANFSNRELIKSNGDISYVYLDNNSEKLAVVFNETNKAYSYPIKDFDQLFSENKYNVLYIMDNQFKVGSSFIKGMSLSTIESDVMSVISRIIHSHNIPLENVMFHGFSKGGFAALYYGLLMGIKNIHAVSPLSKIGDYYSKSEEFESLIEHLAKNHSVASLLYLDNYLFNVPLENYPKDGLVTIDIGDGDYHLERHTEPIVDWLKYNSVKSKFNRLTGTTFLDTSAKLSDLIYEYLIDINKK